MFNIALVVGELLGQATDHMQGMGLVLHHPDAAKNDDTADVQGPFPFLPVTLVVYTQGNLVVGPDGIQPVWK